MENIIPLITGMFSLVFSLFLLKRPRSVTKLIALSWMRTEKSMRRIDKMIQLFGIANLLLLGILVTGWGINILETWLR